MIGRRSAPDESDRSDDDRQCSNGSRHESALRLPMGALSYRALKIRLRIARQTTYARSRQIVDPSASPTKFAVPAAITALSFNESLGFVFGVTYFTGDITIDEPDLKTEVGYGYDGVALGLDFRF